MKCIKEKCEFYAEHDFRSSYFICGLMFRRRTLKKNKDVDCFVDEELENVDRYMSMLYKIKDNCSPMEIVKTTSIPTKME